MISDIEKDVLEWHSKTFPKATIRAIVDKMYEEWREFDDEACRSGMDIFDGESAEEFVDMCIVFIAGRNKLNLSPLSELIRNKLEINKKRSWGKETENGDRPRVK